MPYQKILIFLKLLKNVLKKNPSFGIFIAYEFQRSLYPYDPYLKFRIKELYNRIDFVLTKLISLSKIILTFDFHKSNFNTKNQNKIYNVYFNIFSRVKYNNKIVNNYLKKLFKKIIFKNKVVLDVGSGSGSFLSAFLSLNVKKIYSLDFNNLIKLQKMNYKDKRIKYLSGNLAHIKIKKKFDFIFCNGVLGYQKNLDKVLRKYYNLLKSDGTIYFSLYTNYGLFWKIRMSINSMFKSIPMSYSIQAMKNLFIPNTRTVFLDNWYNPNEKQHDYKKIVRILKKLKYNFELLPSVRKIDIIHSKKYFDFYGHGELRFLIYKSG
jgi:2-polyprenyl-3-methyl-5-hydroxy-6-metoxy-1,4-benzoquinol methylase